MKALYRTLALALCLAGTVQSRAQASLNITFAAQESTPGGQTLANICGYAVGGNEYALCGAADGMWIVDVTVPTNPAPIVQIPMVNSLWKEIKVYQNYAYVTTEGSGGALQIVDLSALPATNAASYNYHTYTGDGAIAGQLSTVHALHIDTTKGFCYLYGSNIGNGGAIILDLNTDPYNPTYAGMYDPEYVHDGYVDNDTLYASHIYGGYFRIVDCTNKANPQVIGQQSTPTNFTHNTWLSDDRNYIFSTDENSDSYLTAYDVSNPSNINEMDRTHSYNPNSGSVVHNTHILGNWAVTSWYKDGITIVDVTRPHNLVTVGYYDTYAGTGNGFSGAWGVYPYLPSGTLVVSNIDEGLFVLSPTYVRACYLEGNVTDSLCGSPLSNVTVTISTVNVSDVTNITGAYATGTAIPGTYTVTFSKPGYQTKVFNNISFAAAQVVLMNVQMSAVNAATLTGQVTNAQTTGGIANLDVLYDGQNDYSFVTDGSGNYTSCAIPAGTYTVSAGAWGYVTQCAQETVSSPSTSINTQLQPGWYDDFTFDFGWTITGNASSGLWERGEPVGTDYNVPNDANPDTDVNGDCSDRAYVTGNNGGSASQDDIDNGFTVLTSPVFDLTGYTNPLLEYDRWFFNDGGSGNPNDSMIIRLTNGLTTVTVETVTASSPNNSTWVHRVWNIASLITPTANMRLSVRAADAPPGHLVEAGFDRFNIVNTVGVPAIDAASANVSVFPNPFGQSTQVNYQLGTQPANDARLELRDLAGRLVAAYPVSSSEGFVNIRPDVSAGVYFVQLISGSAKTKPVKVLKSE